jgi:imidazolonepropionase-like amidohydrolase
MPCTVFEHARIFDGVDQETIEDGFVIVEGATIREVSQQRPKLNGADRIDCRGRTVMPGLIDNHVHIYWASLQATLPEPPITYRAQYAQTYLRFMLSRGFTSVRDVAGGDHGMAMALRDSLFEGPRFFYGGLCLTQTGGHGDLRPMSQATTFCDCAAERNTFAVHADGVGECIKATREELRKGASHIKIMASGGVMSPTDPLDRCQYSEAEIRAVVEECSRHGAYVCAHCHPAEAIRRCVEYGVRSIEHGTMIDEETAKLVAQRGAYVVPTMAVIFGLMEEGPQRGLPDSALEKLRTIHECALRGLEIMKGAGVKMGFGSDLLGPQHRRQGTEFTLRRRVLDPIDILRSATSINAEILQQEGKLGVVRAGAFADLLVVTGNPLSNIELLAGDGSQLTHIMVNGRFSKRPST